MYVDVIVIGAGPAGCSATISLSRLGYKVALVERSDYQKNRFGETVQPEIKKLLVQLAVWEKFLEDKHFSSSGIQSAWGQDSLYEKNYILHPYGSGWHLDRLKFDTMLLNAAENNQVYIFSNARIEQCIDDAAGNWSLTCKVHEQKQELQARFIVDASGRISFIARTKNIQRVFYDRLIGLVACLPLRRNKSPVEQQPVMCAGFALIEAAANGWWYSAELPGSQMVIAYMTDSDLCPYTASLKLADWWDQLDKTKHSIQRATTKNTTDIRLHTLSGASSRLTQFGGNNWLAIGDAAMSFDPLSSHGICKALDSGINAAEQIHEKFISGKHTSQILFHKLEHEWENYLSKREFYYKKENRWCTSLFWQRRQSAINDQRTNKLLLKMA